MPKLVAGNPVILDSGDVGLVISTSRVFIDKISFTGVNVGDTCTLHDRHGNVVFNEVWSTADQPIQYDFSRFISFDGLTLAALTAGQCFVYFY